ncbi:MAG: chemotaxis protein CheB [Endomicrobiales bacterium]|nr:chemotaxis protein CheB [Endomicrobiales bacterium]
MIRLLIVDDSFFDRQIIKRIVSEDPEIQVVGEAKNGREALEKIKELDPDVICLDLIMPKEDGVLALEQIVTEKPTPVVIFSAISSPLSEISKRLSALGVVNIVQKPNQPEKFSLISTELIRNVKDAAKGDAIQKALKNTDDSGYPVAVDKVLVLVCPMARPVELEEYLSYAPESLPAGIIVHQFLYVQLVDVWLERLRQAARMPIRIAEEGDMITQSRILVSPNGMAMEIIHLKDRGVIQLIDYEKFSKPCIDTLLFSVSRIYKSGVTVNVFSGLGPDGMAGIRYVRKNGGKVFINKDQSIIKRITEEKLADKLLTVKELASETASVYGLKTKN